MKKYTKLERKQIAEAFKFGLKNLPDTALGYDSKKSHFICDSIGYDVPMEIAAKQIVQERIGYMFSVEQWLKAQSPQIKNELQNDLNNNQGRGLQAYRKAWLESLIEEFSQ